MYRDFSVRAEKSFFSNFDSSTVWEIMHRYLRAIGFSNIKTKKDVRTLLEHVYSEPTFFTVVDEDHGKCGYVGKSFGSEFGIRAFGELEEDGRFREEYYFPYVESSVLSSTLSCSVERHTDRSAYGGIIEDPGMGISLIFYLNNGIDYINKQNKTKVPPSVKGISLNALCTYGKILLPVYKTEKEREKIRTEAKNRGSLIEAARNGDESAMENLALEDMNLFQTVSRRITREDVYSIVDTCFMPYGLESDQYSVIGEIHKLEKVTNRLTGEDCYRMTLECNNLFLTVMLNAVDLLGEPAVGRRFKGDIWLQGTVVFE